MDAKLAEQMALAVLKGDEAAARALADMLVEDMRDVTRHMPPIRRLPVDLGRVRVAVYFPTDVQIDGDACREAVRGWLEEGRTLLLQGAERMELYEVAEG